MISPRYGRSSRAQTHRRFIKTHTPLDGLPWNDEVTCVVVGRDRRDLMVSMEHHWNNMDLERVLALREHAVGNDDLDTLPQRPAISDDPAERFRAFVRDREYTGAVNLTVVMHHLDTGWQRRQDDNVSMSHYADYTTDLPGGTRTHRTRTRLRSHYRKGPRSRV